GWGEGRLWRNSRPALRVEQGQLKKLPSSAPAGHLLPQAGEGKSLASARASAPPLYARRAIISFLISAIASAGFKPFGQVRAQFMIVWQRYSLNGSSRSSRRAPVSSSRESMIQR